MQNTKEKGKNMENILLVFIVVVGIIVITSILNEKKLHIPHDIALVLGAFLIGIGFIIFQEFNLFGLGEVLKKSNFLQEFHLDHFLLECVLGFIMFASASKLHFKTPSNGRGFSLLISFCPGSWR